MDLKKIDNEVYEVWKVVSTFRYFNPINQKEERKKFFSSKNYNPVFEYPEVEFVSSESRAKLKVLGKKLKRNFKGNLIAQLLMEKIDKLLVYIEMIDSVGKNGFSEFSISYYGKPKRNLVKLAKGLVLKDSFEFPLFNLTSKKMVSLLQGEVDKLDIGWKVVQRSNLGAKAQTSIAKKTLYIKKGETFRRKELQRLVVHELNVHAVRAENGFRKKYKLFFMGTSNYEMIEEGLALKMEEKNGLLSDHKLKNYAGRVLAVDLALRKSFREVYIELRKYFSSDEAYNITMRVKRGLKNTSNPGAFTKDYTYLSGLERLKRRRNFEKLFFGKIDLEDVNRLKIKDRDKLTCKDY